MTVYRWTHIKSGATGVWSEEQHKVIVAKGWLGNYDVKQEVQVAAKPFLPPGAVEALTTNKKKKQD